MRKKNVLLYAGAAIVATVFVAPVSAYTIMAGITLDVHQDIVNPAMWPNDFHIEGWICTRNDVLPLLRDHEDGPFPNFSYSFGPLMNGWYSFTADWWLPPGSPGLAYCTTIHLGLLFDVQDDNTVIKLRGWWTKDGQRVGKQYGNMNDGFVPVLGFSVAPINGAPALRIGNGDVQPPPVLPWPPVTPWPPVPPEPGPIELQVTELQILSVPPAMLPSDWFKQLSQTGAQQTWPWVSVVNSGGIPVGPGNPVPMMPDSFFDIFLEMPAVPPGSFRPVTPVTIAPNDMFFVRTKRTFINNAGVPEPNGGLWEWHIHEAQGPEACCFQDGSCAVLTPVDCAAQGGFPKGPGTDCSDLDGDGTADVCEQAPRGACCYAPQTGSQACVVTDQTTCEQPLGGAWQGAGTTCIDADGDGVADACEPTEACCLPDGTCTNVPADTCQQLGGTPKGVGTVCQGDTDGDGIDEICEPPPEPEACCLPNGSCANLPPGVCTQQGGQPMGPGSVCLGDHDGNGKDDVCDYKWLQPPDLSTLGIDIDDVQRNLLADDFLCKETTRITKVTIWGSWLYDLVDQGNVTFILSLHADIPDPDGAGPLYSMPGQMLWQKVFPAQSYTYGVYRSGITEGWWDPVLPGPYIFPGDHVCWQYDFTIPPAEAFCQRGTPAAPVVYWLAVQAIPAEGTNFGWKTASTHWNDVAVWGSGFEPYPGPWNELRYPPQHPLYQQRIDLAFAIGGSLPCPPSQDFGDAPDPTYPTLLASNGARHIITPGFLLGAVIDSEADGQPTVAAMGDDVNPPAAPDDEDGVVFPQPLTPGTVGTVNVMLTTPGTAGLLDAWIDFNADGDWADPGEQIAAAMPLAPGPNLISFNVPLNSPSGVTTFSRFRLSSAGGLSYTGAAQDGEVEDRAVEIVPPCRAPAQNVEGGPADIDVDLMDFAIFQACFNGPNRPWKPTAPQVACFCLDDDRDNDVDLMDFAAFQACFNGPNRPPKPGC